MSLLEDREKTHGSFDNFAKNWYYLKKIIRSNFEPRPFECREQEALELIALKMARIMSGDCRNPEHWLDIIGYAKLGMGWTSSGDPLDKKTE